MISRTTFQDKWLAKCNHPTKFSLCPNSTPRELRDSTDISTSTHTQCWRALARLRQFTIMILHLILHRIRLSEERLKRDRLREGLKRRPRTDQFLHVAAKKRKRSQNQSKISQRARCLVIKSRGWMSSMTSILEAFSKLDSWEHPLLNHCNSPNNHLSTDRISLKTKIKASKKP